MCKTSYTAHDPESYGMNLQIGMPDHLESACMHEGRHNSLEGKLFTRAILSLGGIFNIHSAAACDGSTRISIEIHRSPRPRKLHVTINIASYDGSGVEYVNSSTDCGTTTEAISTSIIFQRELVSC